MVIICKNWQALPVAATTVTAPASGLESLGCRDNPIQQQTAQGSLSLGCRDNPIQQPTADIVVLNKINHDEPNEPAANTYQNSSHIPLVRPKKRLRIIEQQGILDQFSFSSSSLMVRGAVIAGLVFIISAGKGIVIARPGQDSLSGFY